MESSALNREIMVQKGIFWSTGENNTLFYYPIINYQKIEIYKVETTDMGIFHWNNFVSRK